MEAAKILEKKTDVLFMMIGSGFGWEKIRELSKKMKLPNVKFAGRLRSAEFRREISRADAVLGFFRKGGRASLLIGNKVFEGLSLGKPVKAGFFGAENRGKIEDYTGYDLKDERGDYPGPGDS